jgi:hypothetical protein
MFATMTTATATATATKQEGAGADSHAAVQAPALALDKDQSSKLAVMLTKDMVMGHSRAIGITTTTTTGQTTARNDNHPRNAVVVVDSQRCPDLVRVLAVLPPSAASVTKIQE